MEKGEFLYLFRRLMSYILWVHILDIVKLLLLGLETDNFFWKICFWNFFFLLKFVLFIDVGFPYIYVK